MGKKSSINNKGVIRSFREGDVWWSAIGENVGVEIDGKSRRYSRPIVILKKHSRLLFAAVPLTSKQHTGTWYVPFIFQGKCQTAVLVQTKPMDVTRLYERVGKLSNSDYKRIKGAYLDKKKKKYVPILRLGWATRCRI